ETSAVDHAGYVAVKLYVVQVELRGFNLQRLFFIQIAQVQEFLMTIERVVVKIHFRVERDKTLVFRQKERIYLKKRCVHLLVSRVERLHELRRLIDEF